MKIIIVAICAIFGSVLSTAIAGESEFEYLGKFDASQIPLVSDKTRKAIVKDYGVYGKHQKYYTLAISESGSTFGATAWEKYSSEDHIRLVLQKCEHSAQEPCGIVAHKNKLVKFQLSPRQLIYTEKFDVDLVPFITDKSRDWLRKNYKSSNRNVALAITRNGNMFVSRVGNWKPEEEAAKKALDGCNKGRKRKSCFVYSINQRVLFNSDTDLRPEKRK